MSLYGFLLKIKRSPVLEMPLKGRHGHRAFIAANLRFELQERAKTDALRRFYVAVTKVH